MDEAQQHKEIQKGFNAGYLIEKLNPVLSRKIREGIVDQNNPYFIGFSKGAEQYNQESFFESPATKNVSEIKNAELDESTEINNLDSQKDDKDLEI